MKCNKGVFLERWQEPFKLILGIRLEWRNFVLQFLFRNIPLQ